MKSELIFSTILLSLIDTSCSTESNSEQKSFISRANKWEKTELSVCWENPQDQNASDIQAVRDIIHREYEGKTRLRFNGWDNCSKFKHFNIRIRIADVVPNTPKLGKANDNLSPGMYLNFTFEKWGNDSVCTQSPIGRLNCIRSIALHEFGHAIGLSHEHNRSDRDTDCTRNPQGHDGDTYIGPFDRYSIMNYCYNSSYSGRLSAGDVFGISALYGTNTWNGSDIIRVGSGSHIAAGRNNDGRLEIFWQGKDGNIWRAHQKSPRDAWSSANPTNFGVGSDLAVARNLDGRLELFWRGKDGNIWRAHQNTPGGTWSGVNPTGFGSGSDLTVATNKDGRLELFWRGNDGNIWRSHQSSPGSSWIKPVNTNLGQGKSLSVATNKDGRLELFWVGQNNFVHRSHQQSAGGPWTTPTNMGIPSVKELAVVRHNSGVLELFYQGQDGIYTVSQRSPGGDWNNPERTVEIGGDSYLAVASNKGGEVELFWQNRQRRSGSYLGIVRREFAS